MTRTSPRLTIRDVARGALWGFNISMLLSLLALAMMRAALVAFDRQALVVGPVIRTATYVRLDMQHEWPSAISTATSMHGLFWLPYSNWRAWSSKTVFLSFRG